MSYLVEVDTNGRILIPAKLRARMNLYKGDKVALIEQGETVTLVKKSDRLKEAQALFQSMVGEGTESGVDDFLTFRKEEAGIEQHRLDS